MPLNVILAGTQKFSTLTYRNVRILAQQSCHRKMDLKDGRTKSSDPLQHVESHHRRINSYQGNLFKCTRDLYQKPQSWRLAPKIGLANLRSNLSWTKYNNSVHGFLSIVLAQSNEKRIGYCEDWAGFTIETTFETEYVQTRMANGELAILIQAKVEPKRLFNGWNLVMFDSLLCYILALPLIFPNMFLFKFLLFLHCLFLFHLFCLLYGRSSDYNRFLRKPT